MTDEEAEEVTGVLDLPTPVRTLLVADHERCRRMWLVAALSGLGIVVEFESGDEFERAVLEEQRGDLLVACAAMPPPSALHVLTAARASGIVTPFIVITDVRDDHARAFISDSKGTRVEPIVMSASVLRSYAESLLQLNSLEER